MHNVELIKNHDIVKSLVAVLFKAGLADTLDRRFSFVDTRGEGFGSPKQNDLSATKPSSIQTDH